LDVTCVYDKEGKSLIINVVNRHEEKNISTDIVSNSGNFTGKASVTEINNRDIQSPYTFDKRDQYIPVTKKIAAKGNTFTYTFSAHSFTQITVKLE
jgi:alpha-N-arabinofuranosidase